MSSRQAKVLRFSFQALTASLILFIDFFYFSKPLSKTLFTLHRKSINICNLRTCTNEESVPLFTTLHPLFTRKICVNLWIENRRPKGKPNLWDIRKVVSAPRPNRSRFRFNSVRNPKVKSGEEWSITLHLSQPQCLSGFQPIWWRVKSKKKSGAFIKKLPTYRFVPGNGSLLPG